MKLLGYIRVSGKGQVEKDGPVRQRMVIGAFAQSNQLEVVRYFSDPGVSGTVDGMDRPGFFEMLELAADLGAEGIVVEKMDRLARDLIVSEMIFRELRKRNLKLYSAEQGLVDFTEADTDPSRKLIRQIFAAVAEYDKANLVAKMRAARVRRRNKTGKCEGPKGYGFRANQGLVVNAILKARNDGGSFSMIARTMNLNETPRLGGKVGTWDASAVSKLYNRVTKQRERAKQNEHITYTAAVGQPAVTSSGGRQDQVSGASTTPVGASDERGEVGQWLPMPP